MANGPRKLSFDIASARNQLDKMIRESERLEATDDRIEKSDHAINAAMTGWHIHEWVWAEVKEIERSEPPAGNHLDSHTQEQLRLQLDQQKRKLAELRVEIGKELGVNPGSVGKDQFGAYMARKHSAIEACRIIATGSKHLNSDNADDLETYVSAGPSYAASPVQINYTGVPKIRLGNLVTSSSDAFREAQRAWTEMIYEYKIDR